MYAYVCICVYTSFLLLYALTSATSPTLAFKAILLHTAAGVRMSLSSESLLNFFAEITE